MSGGTLKELIGKYRQNGGVPSAFIELAEGLEGKSGQELLEFEEQELEKAKARLDRDIHGDPYGWAEASYIQGRIDLLESLQLTTAEAEEILKQNNSEVIRLVKYIREKDNQAIL